MHHPSCQGHSYCDDTRHVLPHFLKRCGAGRGRWHHIAPPAFVYFYLLGWLLTLLGGFWRHEVTNMGLNAIADNKENFLKELWSVRWTLLVLVRSMQLLMPFEEAVLDCNSETGQTCHH